MHTLNDSLTERAGEETARDGKKVGDIFLRFTGPLMQWDASQWPV